MKLSFFTVILLFVLASCTTRPKTQDAETVNAEPDSIQIIQKLYKNTTDLIEYEIPVLRGTSMKHGIQKRFYRHGSLYSAIPYDHGMKVGTAYTYYPAAEGVKPVVWKEQSYKKNVLNGACKRYHKDGILQAEYEYKNGNPAIGLKEYSQSGKAIKQLTLILSANRTATGYYVTARLSNNTKKVDFFIGKSVEGKYLPDGLKGLQVKNGLGEIIVDASKKKVTITAVYMSRYRNRCLVSKTINLQ